MNIGEILPTLKAEVVLRKTPCGRPVTEDAVAFLEAAISDDKNHESPAIRCLNCCIIQSSLLVPEGCVNCGGKDLTMDIKENDVL